MQHGPDPLSDDGSPPVVSVAHLGSLTAGGKGTLSDPAASKAAELGPDGRLGHDPDQTGDILPLSVAAPLNLASIGLPASKDKNNLVNL